MSLTTRVGLLAGASALTLTGASLGNQTATETSTEVLRAEIAALKAQVARLGADENWLTEQRSEEIRPQRIASYRRDHPVGRNQTFVTGPAEQSTGNQDSRKEKRQDLLGESPARVQPVSQLAGIRSNRQRQPQHRPAHGQLYGP